MRIERKTFSEKETLQSFDKQCKVVKKDLWRDFRLQDLEKIPYEKNGLLAQRLV